MDASDNSLISIIIPAHNAESGLPVTLDSLLAQSFRRWEAFIVDNGSTDQTAAIVGSYSARDGRISRLVGANQGVSAARNLGLAAARGRWVLFLDAGDWIDKRHLDKMTSALAASPGAFAAYCGCRHVMPDGSLTPDHGFRFAAHHPFEMPGRPNYLAIHAVLIERDVIARVGAFDTTLKTCEDWDLWQRVARLGGRWVHVDEPLCYRASAHPLSAHSLSKNAAQLLTDARTVIARGFGVDDRVPHAAPEDQHGATIDDGNTADRALASFAFWCGGIDCAQGGNGAAAFDTLASLPPPAAGSAPLLADALFDGIVAGLCVVPKQLAARWEEFGPRTTALIAKLGDVWNDRVAARALRYRLEWLILDCGDLAQPRQLGLTLGFTLDIRDPAPVTPPAGIDRFYVSMCHGDSVQARVDLGVLGAVTRRQWIDLMIRGIGIKKTVAGAGASMWPSLVFHLPGHAVREVVRHPRFALRHHRSVLATASTKAILDAAGAPRPAGSHAECLHQLRLDTELAAVNADDVVTVEKPSSCNVESFHHPDRRGFWETWFEKEDPWNYNGSAYEQEKYARQIDLLPDRTVGVALELACAEGKFTEQLADHVDRLIATDISTKALERAQARCREKSNIEYRQLDFSADPLPDAIDLIFCSEVLYYLNDEDELREVAKRLAAALKPGGYFLTAHAYVLKDDVSRTGFDWETPFGAEVIARVFAETPGLALERSLQAEVYRIDRFIKLENDSLAVEPVVENKPIMAALEPEVERSLVWGGAVARRTEVALTERRPHVPVLLYHRIACEGTPELAPYRVAPEMFRAQMTWLRRNGYHFINSGQLGRILRGNRPFAGRPVMISFDDGFQDFVDQAWPILRVHDFSAEVFIVSDFVGKTAQWDAGLGGDFPLMDTRGIAKLATEGVLFGSHLASHRAADGLSTRELAEELLRSRAMLGKWLGAPPSSFAAPHGVSDERLRILAAECGFTTGFSTQPGVASLQADPMNLPRIEVRGDWTLDDFIGCMERFL